MNDLTSRSRSRFALLSLLLSAALGACGGSDEEGRPVAPAPAPAADQTPPTTPTALVAQGVSTTGFTLQWAASTDNVGVTGYDVYQNGTLIATAPGGGTSHVLTGLAPQTVYALQVRARDAAGNASGLSAAMSVTTAAATSGSIYWVSKAGNDANACTQSNPCLTLQRGISVLQPGDTLNIQAGNYIERSASSAHTRACEWFGTPVSLCMARSGTAAAPITVQAAPNAQRQVTLDGEGVRAAIHLLGHDYITFKGLLIRNSREVGIVNWSQAQNEVANSDELSVGVRVEDNLFLDTLGIVGGNTSSVAMWGSKDWVVRNNVIDGVEGNGIQAYGVINALIENNTIRNVSNGIYWKDHFIQDVATRALWQESEIRYNDITATRRGEDSSGVYISIRGTNSVEAGHSQVHHNIIRSTQGIRVGMRGAFAGSGELKIFHNIVDGQDAQFSNCIQTDGFRSVELRGNILVRCGSGLVLFSHDTPLNKLVQLTASDRNLWDARFQVVVDGYSATVRNLFSLPEWQAVRQGQFRTVAMSGPDGNSMTAPFASLFSNGQTYAYSTTSPAINLMGPGRNAGPYETGAERIGANF